MRSKYLQYSQKSYLDKVNPQFIGIAKTLQVNRKHRKQVQYEKLIFDQQLLRLDQLNKNLQKNLSKKKKQLKDAESLRSRYLSQIKQKEMIDEHKEKQLLRMRSQNQQLRTSHKTNKQKAYEDLYFKKKRASQSVKSDLASLNRQRQIRQSRILDLKQSRVQLIQLQKMRSRQFQNEYHHIKNKQHINNYQQFIRNQQNTSENYRRQMRELQSKLVQMKQKAIKKQSMLSKLDESINDVKRQTSACSSRMKNKISTRQQSSFNLPQQNMIQSDNNVNKFMD